MVHFDTNFLIAALQNDTGEQRLLEEWLNEDEDLAISVIAWAEFLCGPLSPDDDRLARELFPEALTLERPDAEKAASLFNTTGRRSRSLPDCLIASIALREDADLATNNTLDFRPFCEHGLRLATVAS